MKLTASVVLGAHGVDFLMEDSETSHRKGRWECGVVDEVVWVMCDERLGR